MMTVYIHTGLLSVDNGARFPLSLFTELTQLLQVPADYGTHYGNSLIEIEEKDWPVTEELLIETKMLYRVKGKDADWQNVQTDIVRQQLEREAAALARLR